MANTHFGDKGGQAGANKVLEVDLVSLFQKQSEQEGLSTREIAVQVGKPEPWVRHRLRQLIEAGKVKYVGHKTVQGVMDGRFCSVPAYQLSTDFDD